MFGLFKKKEAILTVLDQCNAIIEQIKETGAVNVETYNSPFRLQNDERVLIHVPATLYLWKNSGKYGQSGLTASIKIVNGLRYTVRSGRVGMQKKWMPDDDGNLTITNKRIVFNGSKKNNTCKIEKVIEAGISDNGKELLIGRESGADWRFAIGEVPLNNLALGLAYLSGMILE